MISDFRQRRDFTVEVETTPACGMDCPWCENRKSKPFDSFADDNVCFEKLLEFLALAQTRLPGQQIRVVLNGGEPTMHPGLLGFVQKASLRGYSAELLTNMSAPVELYVEAMSAGCLVVPTFHLGQTPVRSFVEKLAQLGIGQTRAFVASASQLVEVQLLLPGIAIEAVVPEGAAMSETERGKLATMSDSARKQLQLKAVLAGKAKKPRICWSCRQYLYVNGDGTVQPCMFLPREQNCGNISNIAALRWPKPRPCANPWCFYAFERV